MDKNGIPQKVNRHVLKAVRALAGDPGEAAHLADIINEVKFSMRNLVPVRDVDLKIRQSLFHMHLAGVLHQKSANEFALGNHAKGNHHLPGSAVYNEMNLFGQWKPNRPNRPNNPHAKKQRCKKKDKMSDYKYRKGKIFVDREDRVVTRAWRRGNSKTIMTPKSLAKWTFAQIEMHMFDTKISHAQVCPPTAKIDKCLPKGVSKLPVEDNPINVASRKRKNDALGASKEDLLTKRPKRAAKPKIVKPVEKIDKCLPKGLSKLPFEENPINATSRKRKNDAPGALKEDLPTKRPKRTSKPKIVQQAEKIWGTPQVFTAAKNKCETQANAQGATTRKRKRVECNDPTDKGKRLARYFTRSNLMRDPFTGYERTAPICPLGQTMILIAPSHGQEVYVDAQPARKRRLA